MPFADCGLEKQKANSNKQLTIEMSEILCRGEPMCPPRICVVSHKLRIDNRKEIPSPLMLSMERVGERVK